MTEWHEVTSMVEEVESALVQARHEWGAGGETDEFNALLRQASEHLEQAMVDLLRAERMLPYYEIHDAELRPYWMR